MFNFTTQTVYNRIKTATVNAKGVRVPKDANIILNTINGVNPTLRIGNTRFNKNDIIDIQVKNPSVESLATVTFDLAPIVAKVTGNEAPNEVTARIALYIGLSMNSQDSFYANDFVYKGKPLYIEFYAKKGEGVDVVAKRAKAIADKYMLFTTPQRILDVTINATAADSDNDTEAAGSITFTGVDGYQQIKKAELQWYNPEAKTVDCCTMDGDYEVLVQGVPVIYTINEDTGIAEAGETAQKMGEDGTPTALADNEVAILPGLEAFGDYNWIIHNLRLPTLANTNFWSPTKQMDEMPVPGNQYTQFIIRMCVERDGIAGQVVGQRATSVTTHVLYVSGLVTDANSPAGLVNKALFTDLGVTAKKTDADDKLATPFEDA